jgi:hypothetical protein
MMNSNQMPLVVGLLDLPALLKMEKRSLPEVETVTFKIPAHPLFACSSSVQA